MRVETETAMVNEVLCKLVVHNLCVLIQEQHELGIEAIFRPTGSETHALTTCP